MPQYGVDGDKSKVFNVPLFRRPVKRKRRPENDIKITDFVDSSKAIQVSSDEEQRPPKKRLKPEMENYEGQIDEQANTVLEEEESIEKEERKRRHEEKRERKKARKEKEREDKKKRR